ncbi:MAG: hypothetical protein ACK4KT_05080 [Thermaurantimonas sp.]
MSAACSRTILLVTILTICLAERTSAQELRYQIMAPEPESVIPAENLFVSIALEDQRTFVPGKVKVFLNKKPIYPDVKTVQNTMSFIHYELLRNGRNHLRIFFKIQGISSWQEIEWVFYVNERSSEKGDEGRRNKEYSFGGTISIDNREQYLTGPGAALRQEPPFTRTATANTRLVLDKVTIPFQMFATSDNRNFIQSRNFFQTGIQTPWLEALVGDINPAFDRLVLSGVRITGASAQIKAGGTGVQIVHGRLNRAIEGQLEAIDDKFGSIPIHMVNDSQYVIPGMYRRDITAVRMYMGNKKKTWIMALNGLKAKDDTNSIRYGLAPKDNIVAGVEFQARLFRRRIFIQSGMSISAVTNDISLGAISKIELDTAFNIKFPFDPANFQRILIINSSTKPTKLSTDFLSYFVSVNWNTSWHQLTADYSRIGPQYFSLSNPFLRNNSDNLLIQERFFFFKRKLTLTGTYQGYTNNLNNVLLSTLRTDMYGAGLMLNISNRYPTVVFQYNRQGRVSTRSTLPGSEVDDFLTMINGIVSYNVQRGRWNTTLRISGFVNDRTDRVRPNSSNTFYNGMFGIGERVGSRTYLSVDFGKTLLYNHLDEKLSDVNAYNASVTYDVFENKFQVSALVGNNRAMSSVWVMSQIRNSFIVRMRYMIVKGLNLDLEGGWQPFEDRNMPVNNYQDGYAYARISYDFYVSNRPGLK